MRRFQVALLAVALCSQADAASWTSQELQAVLRRTPDPEAGAVRFAPCAACHGQAGEGQAEGWAPRLGGQHYEVIVRELIGYRRGQRRDDRMQAYSAQHRLPSPQDIADVAAHAASLPGAAPGTGPGESLALGAQVYAAQCRSCHGERGEGSESRGVPRLASQHYSYLVRQLHDFVEGRRPTATREHVRRIGTFDRDQITGLADYLSRQP
jgi:cytochrome c553